MSTTPKLSFEYLELLASAHAPPSGAVLWTHSNKPRLVRHDGEPLTVEYVSGLITRPGEVTTAVSMPPSFMAIADHKRFSVSPKHTKHDCDKALLRIMRTDCVDSDLLRRGKVEAAGGGDASWPRG